MCLEFPTFTCFRKAQSAGNHIGLVYLYVCIIQGGAEIVEKLMKTKLIKM